MLLARRVVARGVLAAGTARADGDPASDYLLSSEGRSSRSTPRSRRRSSRSCSRSSTRPRTAGLQDPRRAHRHQPTTSAPSPRSGAKPQTYARFLGAELRFVYKQRLLVVMPNGFGFYWQGHPVDREQGVLAKIPVGQGAGRPRRRGRDGRRAARRGGERDGSRAGGAKTTSSGDSTCRRHRARRGRGDRARRAAAARATTPRPERA